LDTPLAHSLTVSLGVVVAREAIDNPWQSHIWRPLSVFMGAAAIDSWRQLQRGDGYEHYHAATLPMELHRKETEGYATNLASDAPSIYIVLRETVTNGEQPLEVHLVTASPFDVQAYGATSAEIVGRVAMPAELIELVTAFVEAHHVDEPFRKRKRQQHHVEEVRQFGHEPVQVLRERMRRAGRDPGQL
jgi:Protein of unknown function (DUF3305)